jgi:hypothetical protein
MKNEILSMVQRLEDDRLIKVIYQFVKALLE